MTEKMSTFNRKVHLLFVDSRKTYGSISLSSSGKPDKNYRRDGESIKHCQTYEHLGMNITDNGTTDYTIKDRSTNGRKSITMLNSILWYQKILKKNLIHNTIVKIIITYSEVL